jgi:hypothetical protein
MKPASKSYVVLFLPVLIAVSCGPMTPMPDVTMTATYSYSTPTPSPTQSLSITPSPTIPSVPIPTLLSATIVPDANGYHLVTWTPERADGLFLLLENYPETLSYVERGYHDYDYLEAFYYSTWAGYEALLRFPGDPRAERWKWRLGNDISMSYQFTLGGQAGEYYADLISRALNSKSVTIETLPEWISVNNSTAQTAVVKLEAPDGFTNGYVMQLNSAYLWILESANKFQVYPLVDNFHYYPNDFEIRDLTGDHHPEFIVSFFRDTNFVTGISEIYVFDLSRVPSERLVFNSAHDGSDLMRWIGYDWSLNQPVDDEVGIQIREEYLLSCPIYRVEDYRWNGRWLELTKVHFEFELAEVDHLKYCSELLLNSPFLNADPDAVLPLFESLVPYWPIPDAFLTQPPDARYELRFRLGVLNALKGERDKAIEYFSEIIRSPSITKSSWIEQSKRFLDAYTSPDQIYHACSIISPCNPHFAVENLVNRIAAEDYLEAINKLKTLGVPILSSALYDFDRNAYPEFWFTLRRSTSRDIELWVLSKSPNGLLAHYIDNVSGRFPQIALLENGSDNSIVQIDGNKFFAFYRSREGKLFFSKISPKESTLPDIPARQIFEETRKALYAGQDPNQVRVSLLALMQNPSFVCEPKLNPDDSFKYLGWPFPGYCPDFLYTLGLTYELSGDENGAVQAYWQLWHDYPESPYTLVARYKLEPVSP